MKNQLFPSRELVRGAAATSEPKRPARRACSFSSSAIWPRRSSALARHQFQVQRKDRTKRRGEKVQRSESVSPPASSSSAPTDFFGVALRESKRRFSPPDSPSIRSHPLIHQTQTNEKNPDSLSKNQRNRSDFKFRSQLTGPECCPGLAPSHERALKSSKCRLKQGF